MRLSIALGATAAAVGLVLLVAALTDLSLERAALLAPVLVVSAGAVVGLALVWAKALLDPRRRRRSP